MSRYLYYSLLGLVLGLFCAGMATIRQPIPITEWVLLATVYNRFLIGLSLAVVKEFKMFNRWIISFIVGSMVSLAMGLPWGLPSIGFAIAGGIYGLIIEFVGSKISAN